MKRGMALVVAFALLPVAVANAASTQVQVHNHTTRSVYVSANGSVAQLFPYGSSTYIPVPDGGCVKVHFPGDTKTHHTCEQLSQPIKLACNLPAPYHCGTHVTESGVVEITVRS